MRSFMPFSILLLCLFEVSHALSAPAILKGRGVIGVRPRPDAEPDEPEIGAPTALVPTPGEPEIGAPTALVPTPGEPEIGAPTALVPTPGEPEIGTLTRISISVPAVTFSGFDFPTPDTSSGGPNATEPVSAAPFTSRAVASSSVRITTWFSLMLLNFASITVPIRSTRGPEW
ncbi:hypothetical protein K435DRAFT_846980 [Dendrothele bispora CBS 962.96]|uniref:Uncharacterized protein n=1 Tax=Dendrothele bispora (strain CBS 962.96) TaxID=1314807 RepID=A0A4S8KIK1_DENBC|nr:hypothetical protein K435DRAFT_846980 [Dendrothele bispora CBS 962.96]